MIEIIPAIDIMDGRCVRLTKGDYGTRKTYGNSVVEMALSYQDCGVRRIHMVDLDGARLSSPVNLRALESVASRTGLEIEWGGGISSDNALGDCFNAGAQCAIIGSVAVKMPELMSRWLDVFGPDKVILGADVREGKVAVKGWLENSEKTVEGLIEDFPTLKQVICTDISRDGMLEGPTFELYRNLQAVYPDICFTVSGGISSMADIEKLDALGLRKVIVGKAVYEGRIKLKDIEKWQLQSE